MRGRIQYTQADVSMYIYWPYDHHFSGTHKNTYKQLQRIQAGIMYVCVDRANGAHWLI